MADAKKSVLDLQIPVVHRKITDLTPYENNSRTHSEQQIKSVARSIVKFGFTNPVLIRENGAGLTILAGHARCLGAEAVGFEPRSQIIWSKKNPPISRGHYHWGHEPCWYVVRKGGSGHWTGSRKEFTVWDIPNANKSETGHSTQKPVECMRRPILNNSSEGQLVYDPFAGSGTTMVAAELTGRTARMIELDPRYCQLIVDRYHMLFGDNSLLGGNHGQEEGHNPAPPG